MAEGILACVLTRLADAEVREVMRRYGVADEQMAKVMEGLSQIQAVIKGIDRKQTPDLRLRTWVMDLRELFCSIDTMIDTFLLEDSDPEPRKKPLKVAIREWMHGRSKKFRRQMVDLIQKNKDVWDRATNYGIIDLLQSNEGEVEQLARQPAKLSDFKDVPYIGMDSNEQSIVNTLLNRRITRRVVLALVGPEGAGKTRLARRIINRIDVRQHFDHYIWVTISPSARLIDIWLGIVQQLRHEDKLKPSKRNKTDEYFLNKIHIFLKKKRCLMVFDDVGSADICTKIIEKLLDPKNGSRIIITSRICDLRLPTSEIYHINLSTEGSAEVLLTMVNLADNIQHSAELLINIAGELASKCQGLPLMLAIVSGILSRRQPTTAAWSEVLKELEGDVSDSMRRLFNFAYEDLSYVLKLCFTYFVEFPEDYQVDYRSLIRMWIAEGFIPPEENRTLEDTAKSFLVELAQRRLIMISQRSHGGSLRCSMHHLIRDVAVEKANKMGSYKNSSIREKSRCVSCFESVPSTHRPTIFKEIFRNKDGTIDLGNFMETDRARYLEINWGWGTMKECFEKLISRMKFIQTLDLRESEHGDLPDLLWKIQTLRHVFLSGYTAGPPSQADLKYLQTLIGVANRESWQVRLPNLPHLHDLDILLYEGFHGAVLANFINKLEHLNSLKIVGDEIPLKADNLRGCKFSNNLQILHMRVYKAFSNIKALDEDMLPINLKELKLDNCRIEQDPMPILGKLVLLKKLQLRYRACNDKTMSCSPGSFRNLKELEYFALDKLEEWEISDGSMPELEKLTISCCRNLKVPLGLEYLTNLRDLNWLLHKEPNKENEIRNICKKVSSVTVRELDQ